MLTTAILLFNKSMASELVKGKWSEAFLKAVEESTGTTCFTYFLAITKVNGERRILEDDSDFINAMNGNRIKIITFREMLSNLNSG